MSTLLFILFLISLAGVVVSLFAGLVVMGRQGPENRRRSNLLMRARIASQACTVLFLVLYLLVR